MEQSNQPSGGGKSSYDAGLEASRQFAKRQLELSNAQSNQAVNLAKFRGEFEDLKQQLNELQEVVASLSSHQRPGQAGRPWWYRLFTF